MKFARNAALAVALVALPLAGCSTIQGLFNGSTAQNAQTVLNDAKKADTAAHQFHGTVADLLTAAANSGVLHGAAAATAKQYLDTSEGYLVKADGYIDQADGANAMLQIIAGQNATAQAAATITTNK